MLPLSLLVIIYVVLTTCFIACSQDKKNTLRKCYLFINCLIVLVESLPFFMSLHHDSLTVIFDWIPLICLPILHRETALLTAVLGGNALDESFIRFEKKYFPAVMNFHYQNHVNYKLLSEFLHLCYLCFFILIYGIPLFFYLKHEVVAFYESTFAILLLLFSCFITHGIIPVHGPRNIFEKINDHRSHGFFFRVVHKVLAEGSTPGTAFPSGHTGVACIALLMTYHLNTPLFYIIAPVCTGLIVSTVYGRFHYLIDVIVGCIYAIIAFSVTCYLYG